MCTSRYLEELGSDLDIVLAIFDDLDTAFTGIIFRPGITIQLVALLARVSHSCKERMNQPGKGPGTLGLTGERLEVLCSEPRKASHERFRKPRTETKVEIWPVWPP